MKVRCPNCRTLYRLEPVPVATETARCGRCDEVFRLAEHVVAPATAPATSPVTLPGQMPAETAATSDATQADDEGTPPAAVTAASTTVADAEPTSPASAPPTERADATTAAPAGAFRFFGPQDPHQRARHLARALVSDIVAYYPERLEKSRATGNLRDEFREEILKSWEEYVLQVGAEFAHETDHFQTALNDILAQGEKIF